MGDEKILKNYIHSKRAFNNINTNLNSSQNGCMINYFFASIRYFVCSIH